MMVNPIIIPAHTHVSLPISLADYHAEKISIMVGDDAQVQIIDECLMPVVLEIHLGARAHLIFQHQRSWQDQSGTWQLRVHCASESYFEAYVSIHGGALVTYDLALDMHGYKSQARVQVALIASGEQKVAINSLQQHSGTHATSIISTRGIIGNAGQASYKGTIVIQDSAHHTDAAQETKFLLDGIQARADAQPILEVLTNNVQAKHGAAVGQFDVVQCAYLQGRGLALEQARCLIAQGFLSEITHDAHKDFIQQAVHTTLSYHHEK